MRPNPFYLAVLCIALIAAIIVVARTAPLTAPPFTTSSSAQSAPALLRHTVAPAHRSTHARTLVPRRIEVYGDARAMKAARQRARAAAAHEAAQLAQWADERANAAQNSALAALHDAQHRASKAEGALAAQLAARVQDGQRQLGARVQDGQRQAGRAIDASAHRIETGLQNGARSILQDIGGLSWNH